MANLFPFAENPADGLVEQLGEILGKPVPDVRGDVNFAVEAQLSPMGGQFLLPVDPSVLFRGQERPADAALYGGENRVIADGLGRFEAQDDEAPDRKEVGKGRG